MKVLFFKEKTETKLPGRLLPQFPPTMIKD